MHDDKLKKQIQQARNSAAKLGRLVDEWNTKFGDNKAMMNDQIKQIADKVGGYGTQALLDSAQVEKFAELIITECIAAIRLEHLDHPEDDRWAGIYQRAVARNFGYDIIFPDFALSK